jgi:RNA polymerase sigma factor (sigma-70 family)
VAGTRWLDDEGWGNMEREEVVTQVVPPPRAKQQLASFPSFEHFYRASYRDVFKVALLAGAIELDAYEAVDATMEDVLHRWEVIDNPLRYAGRAVVSNLLKSKTRGLNRIRQRQIARGEVSAEAHDDIGLTAWEDQQWVEQMLEHLTPTQRGVMVNFIDGLTPAEIAELLGKSSEAVRQSLCAARRRLRLALRQEQAADPHSANTSAREDLR